MHAKYTNQEKMTNVMKPHDFHRVPYNQTFDFVTGQLVKILSPDCSWKMSITLNRLEYFDKILRTYWY